MELLQAKYLKKLALVPVDFIRGSLNEIDWSNRMIGIKGARGVGKTTLLLQYARLKIPKNVKSLYVSLDDFYFSQHRLYDLATQFVQEGGRILLLDEVHRYKTWSQELKNIYDDFLELQVVFTGSSVIHLSQSKADLSRRAILYEMTGLSFREYLQFAYELNHPILTIEQIIQDHTTIALEIDKSIKPLQYFNEYLQFGFHPFFRENYNVYHQKLGETVNLMLEIDFPSAFGITYATVDKIKTFLVVLAESVPLKPNILKLSEQIGLTRNSLLEHLHHLADAGLLHLLHRDAKGMTRLQKPEKIYLGNPNLAYALEVKKPDIGMLRETFFISQVKFRHLVEYTDSGDFRVDRTYTFEVGGRSKGFSQIENLTDGYVVADGLDVGIGKKIPLWMFGFLY